MTTYDIVFEDPPPAASRGGAPRVWEKRLEPLRARPGEWAVVKTGKANAIYTTADALRHGRFGAGIDPQDWEFVARTKNGEGKVYARFIGADQ